LKEAMPVYEQVIAKTDREAAARAQFMIGEIQFEQKKHREAIVSFFKVVASYGYPRWQADASYEAGRCFEVLGYKSKAIEQYEDLLKNFPDSDKAPLARARLEELRG
jgi:TolA-binding protein